MEKSQITVENQSHKNFDTNVKIFFTGVQGFDGLTGSRSIQGTLVDRNPPQEEEFW